MAGGAVWRGLFLQWRLEIAQVVRRGQVSVRSTSPNANVLIDQLEIRLQDAVHIGQYGTQFRRWTRKGTAHVVR